MSRKTLIPIGPYHPLQEEPELFKLYCDGEIVNRFPICSTLQTGSKGRCMSFLALISLIIQTRIN